MLAQMLYAKSIGLWRAVISVNNRIKLKIVHPCDGRCVVSPVASQYADMNAGSA